jgi:hypothetical protein
MGYSENSQGCASLEELFELWKHKEPQKIIYTVKKKQYESEINHAQNKFIPDGIVNHEVWNDSIHKRILYVLKEAYTDEAKGYDLVDWLNSEPDLRMWNRVARWTYGLQNTSETEIAKYIPDIDKDAAIRKQSFEQIAVMNLKKSGGDSTSVIDEIAAYAKSDREELIRELQLIDPEIVLCGSTFWILYQIVFGKEPLKGNQANNNWFYYLNLDGKVRLYIDYYHPANQWPDLVNYYAVTNIYQQALISKKK